MDDLKPCPFCGSAKVGIHKKRGRTGVAVKSFYYREFVYCKNKQCGAQSGIGKRPGASVAKWNKRVN